MNKLPPLGTRVIYKRKPTRHLPARTCTGTVVAHYWGGDKHRDPETRESYITPDHAGVKVDAPLPQWWPYIGTDRFAPEIEELEPLT